MENTRKISNGAKKIRIKRFAFRRVSNSVARPIKSYENCFDGYRNLWNGRRGLGTRFGVAPKKLPKGRFTPKPQTNGGGRFASDWKYYFLRFAPEQFDKWKAIVGTKTNIQIWIEAVEEVMSEGSQHAKI